MAVRLEALSGALCSILLVAACGRGDGTRESRSAVPAAARIQGGPTVSQSLTMGTGGRSVMSFFGVGSGRGGDLGGLAGADAHCAALATAAGVTDRLWRAYLSTSATATAPAVNARDRIGKGPWYNANGDLIAANLDQLQSGANKINKETAVTENLDIVKGFGDNPNTHDILTGSRQDGTAFPGGEDRTCYNWTLRNQGSAQVGHHDRMGQGESANSWNSAHASAGCSPDALRGTGGAGLYYCFAAD